MDVVLTAVPEKFELQPSVWELIVECCPVKEQEEIRCILGPALVEQTWDLYCEADSLLEIWRQLKGSKNSHTCPSQRLPEPPAMRERLLQEIGFLLEHLERRGKQPSLVTVANPKAKTIVDYVKQCNQRNTPTPTPSHSSRPNSTSRSVDGGRVSGLSTTSQQSHLSEHIETVRECVNVDGIDKIVQQLRETLKEECDLRMEEIRFIQECLEQAREMEGDGCAEPSIQELREFGTALEKEVQQGLTSPTPSKTKAFLPSLRENIAKNSQVSETQSTKGVHSIENEKGINPSTDTMHDSLMLTLC